MRFLRALWKAIRRRPAPYVNPIVDECETCGKALTAIECCVLRSDPDDDVALGIPKGWSGGTYMSATYCAEHFPGIPWQK